jgi:hypothetical protein
MSFPRRRVVGESRDCLLLVLCDAQGLAGPVLKRIRVPVSCYSSVGALAAAAAAPGGEAAAAAAAATSGQQRKRKRDDDAAAAGSVGTPQDEQQQQDQRQQQQQRQPRTRGLLLQPDEHAAELGAAVRWCQSRLTFERVKLELEALQLEVEEVQLLQLPSDQLPPSRPNPAAAANPQQQQVWQQPGIRLLGMPDVQLFQQLQRKPGCAPSSLGLQEVWFSTGPEYGQWRMHVRGSFYHQASAAAGAEGLAAAAAPAVAVGSAKQQQQQQGPADVYEYDLRAGDSVRCAVLQLLRIVHMQLFLNRLESLAWGAQSLQVVQVGSSSSGVGSGLPALQVSSGGTPAAAAAAGGDADVDMAEADGSGGAAPAAKHLKQQQQQDGVGNGLATAAAAGAGMANGIAPHIDGMTSGSGQKPSSNGQFADADEQQQQQQLHKSLTHSPAAAGAPAGIASSSSSPHGLLFHWEGTGLVRLAQYSCSSAILECGAPLQPLAAAGGSNSNSSEASRQRLQFAVHWQPRFEFTTNTSYSSRSSAAGRSSSTTTTQVDVWPSAIASTIASPSAAAGSSSSSGWAHGKAASAQDVLEVTCSMQCNAPHVPADLLNELCDMVNSGCIDLLLDGFSLVAWPLAGVAAALAAPVQPAAQLAGQLRAASCRTVSSCAVSGPYHVRYRVEWQQQQQQGAALVAGSSAAGAPLPAAAAAAAAVAAGLVFELQFACHGKVKVLIRQHDPAAAAQQQHPSSASAARQATAAAVCGFVRHFMRQQGARVPLLPAVSTGHYLTVLPEQGSRSADAVAGFWLQAQHLGVVLQELLQYWQQHVVGKQQQQKGAAAAAVKVEALAAAPQQRQQQQVQGQQQQQPVPQQAGQGAGAMPQQQQQLQPGQVPVKPEQQQQQ